MKNINKFFEKIISRHLDQVDLESVVPSDIDHGDIVEEIDASGLAKEIAKSLHEITLTFNPTPKIDTSYSLSCPSCGLTHGVWACNGMDVNQHILNSPGKRIIIVDDI